LGNADCQGNLQPYVKSCAGTSAGKITDTEHSPNPTLKFLSTLKGLPARFKRYLGAVGCFGMGEFCTA
jgi:hypothetical protein